MITEREALEIAQEFYALTLGQRRTEFLSPREDALIERLRAALAASPSMSEEACEHEWTQHMLGDRLPRRCKKCLLHETSDELHARLNVVEPSTSGEAQETWQERAERKRQFIINPNTSGQRRWLIEYSDYLALSAYSPRDQPYERGELVEVVEAATPSPTVTDEMVERGSLAYARVEQAFPLVFERERIGWESFLHFKVRLILEAALSQGDK